MIQDRFEEAYSIRMRVIVFSVIAGMASLFYLNPKFDTASRMTAAATFEEVIDTFDIPETRQFEVPPAPSRPSIPIESEDEDFAEDITIEETDLDDFEWEAPPKLTDDPASRIKFIPYDEPPEPIGGYIAIQRMVVYPEIALRAGIEGSVTVQVFVNNKGFVEETIILSGIPQTGLNEAAANAIKRVRFKPARQRDRAVGVWISVPIHFKLTATDSNS